MHCWIFCVFGRAQKQDRLLLESIGRVNLAQCGTFKYQNTHIQLNNPQEGDEKQIERHKQAEGAADVGDGLALCRRHEQVR